MGAGVLTGREIAELDAEGLRERAATNSSSALRSATSRSGWAASPAAVTITGCNGLRSAPTTNRPTTPRPTSASFTITSTPSARSAARVRRVTGSATSRSSGPRSTTTPVSMARNRVPLPLRCSNSPKPWAIARSRESPAPIPLPIRVTNRSSGGSSTMPEGIRWRTNFLPLT